VAVVVLDMWIYLRDKKKFLEIADSDPRVSRPPEAPPGCVRFKFGKPSRNYPNGRWHYTPCGATPDQAAAVENSYNLERIKNLEEQIASIRLLLVSPP
jgi:hypothetical protein